MSPGGAQVGSTGQPAGVASPHDEQHGSVGPLVAHSWRARGRCAIVLLAVVSWAKIGYWLYSLIDVSVSSESTTMRSRESDRRNCARWASRPLSMPWVTTLPVPSSWMDA